MRLEGQRYVKEAVREQIRLGLPGNIAMDAPELNFKGLSKLAQNRVTWKASFMKKVPALSLTQDVNKYTVIMQSPTQTATELLAAKEAWGRSLKRTLTKRRRQNANVARVRRKTGRISNVQNGTGSITYNTMAFRVGARC